MDKRSTELWLEGFIKQAHDAGLTEQECAYLLKQSDHISSYLTSESYREGFDKEAQGAGGYLKGLLHALKGGGKGLPGKGLISTPGRAAATAGAGVAGTMLAAPRIADAWESLGADPMDMLYRDQSRQIHESGLPQMEQARQNKELSKRIAEEYKRKTKGWGGGDGDRKRRNRMSRYERTTYL